MAPISTPMLALLTALQASDNAFQQQHSRKANSKCHLHRRSWLMRTQLCLC
jgi:hypothetical protein